jgi:hypothetical protein
VLRAIVEESAEWNDIEFPKTLSELKGYVGGSGH